MAQRPPSRRRSAAWKPTPPFAGNRGGIAAEPFSLEKLKTSDVLLNYAAIDDYPLHDGKPGWVSQLHRNLEVRMEQLSGEKVRIARLPEDAISPVIEAELLEHVPQAKAMISVVSPPFINSAVVPAGGGTVLARRGTDRRPLHQGEIASVEGAQDRRLRTADASTARRHLLAAVRI